MNTPADSPSRDLRRAILMMLASTLFFGSMAVMIRLASTELHPFEIAFFRNLFGFVFALPLLFRHGVGLLRTSHLSLYFMRCLIGIGSMLCGFWAIVNLPLAEAISISYAAPLFVTIGAALVLGEVVRIRRWSAVVIGFLGVLLIVRPGASSFNVHTLAALAAAVLSGSVAISIKFLSRTEKPDAIVLYTTLLWVPMSLAPALFVWTWPHGITWLWIVLAGFFGTVGHMFWTRALKLGDASLLTPISFVQVLIVGVYGWLLFDETVDRWTVAGATVVLASNYYIAYRETRLARQTVTDPEVGSQSRLSG
jgi:drug/metabolite transporter (DMT)-like permease